MPKKEVIKMTNINRRPEQSGALNADKIQEPAPGDFKKITPDNVDEVLKAMRADIGITDTRRVTVRRARMFN